ncbi:MAG TPA: sugar ABC transporter permease [Nocardioidaceae bacterium]|nr:sugar ABC transporter permease [Nocardioidaceae bacterium]
MPIDTGTLPEAQPRAPEPLPEGQPRPQGRLRTMASRHWYAWAMVLPVVVVLGVLVLYPLARGVYISFTDLTESNQRAEVCTKTLGGGEDCHTNPKAAKFVGVDNYVDILSGKKGHFWLQFTNTMVWTTVGVFFHYTIGLGLAVLLNRRVRGRGLYRVLLIVPWAVPAFVSAFAWKFIFNERNGIANVVLKTFGLDPVQWFGDRWTSMFTAIVTNVWLGVPFMMVALLGGMQSISADLYEAAEMDGASPWQRFVNVTLPGLRPVSATVILLGVIWTFNMFPIIFLVTGGQPAGQTEILVTGAFRAAFEGIRQYALASAYGVLILSMLLVFGVAYRKMLSRQGEVW